jgi:hypothetical protein
MLGRHQGQRSRADRAIRPLRSAIGAGRPVPPGTRSAALHGDFGPADATKALISSHTSASCPRNWWPPRSIVTNRAPRMREKPVGAEGEAEHRGEHLVHGDPASQAAARQDQPDDPVRVTQPELQNRAAASGEPDHDGAADPEMVEQQGVGIRLPGRGGTWRQRRTEVPKPRRRDDPETGPRHPRPPAIHGVDMTPQHPMTDQKRNPWPFCVYSIAPKPVLSLSAGTALMRSQARRMSSRYRLITPLNHLRGVATSTTSGHRLAP